MLRIRHLVVLLVAASLSGAVIADYSTDQIEMAATGRFDLLEKSVEEYARSHPLTTADQHALCYAYSKTKRYTRLLTCLDQLEEKIRNGDRRTRLFGLPDATPAVRIMRAEALIELGRYPEASDEAARAVTWLKDDNSDELDIVFNALAALSLARTLGGDENGGWQADKELRSIKLDLFSDYVNAQAYALARARMGLRDYRGVIEAIRGDASFPIKVFLDRLVSGSFLTGINNWVWAELPRAFMLNHALFESGQSAEAKEGFDRLLGIKQVAQNGEIYWLLLSDRGRIAEDEGQLEDALTYYRRAIDIVEAQRASIDTEASKIGFVGNKQAIYSQVVDLARRLDRPMLAFEYMERSKSRALIDLLAARHDTKPLAARDSNTQELLDKYRQAEESAGIQLPMDMASANPTSNRLLVSGQARELRAKDPGLASLVAVTALPASEIQRHINPDEALIEFSGSGENLFGLAMNGTDSMLLRLDAKRVEADTREFRALIQRRSSRASQLAAGLYQQLIKPFEGIIGSRNLLLVPHGTLHYLPFAALNDGTNVIIARRSLRFLPSASVQEYMRPPKKIALDNLLILGNPTLDDERYNLPAAESEVKMLAALLPKSELLIRQVASETAFKKLAGRYSYLHIASHGEFNSDRALDSRLLLAKDSQNDGSLTVRELYDLRLDAALATLSACETGLGKEMGGDDLIGLTRGFLYAGANNVVASLWPVSDEATALLMKGFYSRLKIGTQKKEALREAQLELQKTFPQPFFWAAFYLTGDGT